MNGIAALRRIAEKHPVPQRCELCSETIADEHPHLIEPADRRLLCCCNACSILFDHGIDQRYRRVPRDIVALSGLRISDVFWKSIGIPIGLAFFFRSSVSDSVLAVYPSPGGPTETTIEGDIWEEMAALDPAIGLMQRDVQALLVNRIHGARESYLVPIDACYKLTGIIRMHWKGMSGGDRLWEELRAFFNTLSDRSAAHASAGD